MKKLFISIVAVCFALMLAAPTMALDTDTTGHMRVRGFAMGNTGLDKNNQDSDAYFDTRIRMQTAIKVNDKVSLTFMGELFDGYRLGVASGQYNTGSDGVTGGDAQIDFRRAYATVLTDFGKFDIGRMSGGAWGTTFGDWEGDYDRIKYTLPYSDNLTLVGIIQKSAEGDTATGTGADNDMDVYYLAGIYKMENATLGLLGAYVNGRDTPNVDVNKRVLIPYFKSQFGDLAIQGELIYEFGGIETAAADTDIAGLAYNVEVNYDIAGPFSFEAGYAYVSGEDSGTDTTIGNKSYGGIGADWDKFVVFADADCLLNDTTVQSVTKYGVKLWYVGAKYALTEDITLWGNIGAASAAESLTAADDSYGTEYDISMSWNVMDNLTYTLRAGFLQAGDLWKTIKSVTEVDDTFTIYHKLQVDF